MVPTAGWRLGPNVNLLSVCNAWGAEKGISSKASFLICTTNSWLKLFEGLIWPYTLTAGSILLWPGTALSVELWEAHLLCLWLWAEWTVGWGCGGIVPVHGMIQLWEGTL